MIDDFEVYASDENGNVEIRKVKDIDEFFKNEYVNFASYDNVRKIASYIDGLKNSSRKVIHTILDKNIVNEYKIQRMTSLVAEYTEFIHGENNLEGVICNLAQNFTCSNNINLLYPEGNFGTRFAPTPSAARYIYSHKEKVIDYIFRKEDSPILIQQMFEGNKIEPKFFVPIIPMLLVNGANGVSLGFAQKILPRNPKELIKHIETFLKNGKLPKEILPHFNGFKGVVRKTEPLKYDICGTFERKGRGTIVITELPNNYNQKSYKKVLKTLMEKKIIKRFRDLSEDDNFLFEVSVSLDFMKKTDESILSTLKLVNKFTENLTTLDEDLKIRVFKDEVEILEAYIQKRLEYHTKRKNYRIEELSRLLEELEDRKLFVSSVVSSKLKIFKRNKEDIVDDCKKLGIKNYDMHLRLGIFSLTEEKIQELKNQIDFTNKELEYIKSTSEKDIWLKELQELKKII